MIFFYYLLTSVVVTIINTIPVFMPETWVVLSFFYIQYDLSFPLVILIGTLFSTVGRILLALLTRKYLYKVIPKKLLANYHDLGILFSPQQRSTFSSLLAFTFIPLPESQVFMAAGLANVSLRLLAIASILRSVIVYSFWVKSSSIAIGSLQGLFSGHGQAITVVINLLSFGLLIAIGIVPWGKLVKKK